MSPFHEPGTLLQVRGEQWLLTASTVFDGCSVLSLEGRSASNFAERLRIIEPFERARRATPTRPDRVSRQRALRAALAASAATRPPRRLWTAAHARITLLPYQLEPALAVVAGATRVLLADAVGLGKTIQAALILAELRARGWIERALIVCPAGLRDTWAAELRDRFRLRARVFDQAAVAEQIAASPPGVNPWSGEPIVISSIDFIKRAEVMAALAAVPIDLLIVDEAHHLVPRTERGASIGALAARSPWCVFASATPHSGDVEAFNYLANLGSRGDPLTTFRRSRGDVGLPCRRRTRHVAVAPTAAEAALLAAVDVYVRAIWTGRGHADPAARLVAITLARRAASSRSAIERTLTRRLELLRSESAAPTQAVLPWEEDNTADDACDDAVLATVGLDNAADECLVLERLIERSRACEASSKLERVARLLRRVRESAIVFTEYRDTLDAIVRQLGGNRRIGAIHGGTPAHLRRSIVDAFNAGRLDLLVATDTAGEGLNLHWRCRLVIDFELPWNPVRLEQRIGRIDRLGQPLTVHAVRLFHADSIEARVRERLDEKTRIAASALRIGIDEADMAAAVLGERPLVAAEAEPIVSTAVDGAVVEAARLERQRVIAVDDPLGAVWARGRGRSGVLVERLTWRNSFGASIGDALIANTIELGTTPRRDGEWRAVIAEAIRRVAARHSAAPVTPMHSAVTRIDAIRSTLAAQATAWHQASLFDGRDDAARAARRRELESLDAALDRVRQRIDSATVSTHRQLVAFWGERRR